MTKEQKENRNKTFLELRKEGFINESTESEIAFKLGYEKAINYSQCCKSDSEQFSFADMRDAFDYASVSSQRRDGMTFKEWMSKR